MVLTVAAVVLTAVGAVVLAIFAVFVAVVVTMNNLLIKSFLIV